MNPEREHPLTTADLAKADETRGHTEEHAVGRESVLDREPPAGVGAPPQPAVARSSAAESRPASGRRDERPALFGEHDAADLRRQWSDVQAGFVDEPRRAVEQADALVADVMKRLAESFASERATLERQWDRGDNVTTEDLRVALQRYRSFFDRLLSI
jgi:hypothetical protein